MKANGTKRKIFNDAVNLLNGAGDMVESIREHGILNPVIVWQHSDGYEMLAGHNRQNAGKLAKQAKIKLDANTAKCLKGMAGDVTVQSKNTGHYWYIHNPEHPEEDACVIFHKHRASHPYHQHGKTRNLRQAIKKIKGHDEFQMNGKIV